MSSYEGLEQLHNQGDRPGAFQFAKVLFEFDPTYRYVGAVPAQLTKSYGTADARVGWRFTRNFELSLAGQNLLQPRHAEFGSVMTERSAYAQITWKQIVNCRLRQGAWAACVPRWMPRVRGCRRKSPPWIPAVALAAALIGLPSMRAQHSKPTEYEVKATYLYNFSRFVEWPAKSCASRERVLRHLCAGAGPLRPGPQCHSCGRNYRRQERRGEANPSTQDRVNCFGCCS